MKYLGLLVCLSIAALASGAQGDNPPAKFELKDGDRVAFIGNTFVEREAKDCYIETMLTSRFPDRNITFRNLGYSADTVTGSARGLCIGWSVFEAPDKAFERLRKLVAEFKPTVLLMNYGMTESFTGPEGIPQFTANYNKMLDALSAAAGTSPRIVLMSPNYHEDLGRPLPDPAEHNKSLKLYSEAIGQIASIRGCVFVDLYSLLKDEHPRLTTNGIHLSKYGYWEAARVIEKALWGDVPKFEVDLVFGQDPKVTGTRLLGLKASPDSVSFTATDEVLGSPPIPGDMLDPKLSGSLVFEQGRRISIKGLKPGTSYQFKANHTGRAIQASAELWARGLPISNGSRTGSAFSCDPNEEQAEALRKLIVAKNFDFFNYQRPDNDAYILAFRRGEQGRNAPEIPQFLPLVAEKEKQIAELRVPKPVTYTLEAVK